MAGRVGSDKEVLGEETLVAATDLRRFGVVAGGFHPTRDPHATEAPRLRDSLPRRPIMSTLQSAEEECGNQ